MWEDDTDIQLHTHTHDECIVDWLIAPTLGSRCVKTTTDMHALSCHLGFEVLDSDDIGSRLALWLVHLQNTIPEFVNITQEASTLDSLLIISNREGRQTILMSYFVEIARLHQPWIPLLEYTQKKGDNFDLEDDNYVQMDDKSWKESSPVFLFKACPARA